MLKNFSSFESSLSPQEIAKYREENLMNVVGSDIPPPIMDFTDLSTTFGKNVIEFLLSQKFTKPTCIQAQGWPMALSGRDLVGIAQTGSGKTLSFVLPALLHCSKRLSENSMNRDSTRPDRSTSRGSSLPYCLVLAPTRELVIQIHDVVRQYIGFYGLRSTTVYGGVPSYPQKRALSSGCHVVVATPGRLIDLYKQNCVELSNVSFLILDEADRMLDMGFEPQLREIIPKTHKNRQTLMWSATWPREVRDLCHTFMNDYIQVTIGTDDLSCNKKISQEILFVEYYDKKKRLLEILSKESRSSSSNRNLLIVFCNTKKMCDNLEDFLLDNRFKAIALHGDKSQNARDKVIQDFKSGYKNILIATDVAARGLDVKNVHMVVNYDFPKNVEDYVHRIGRTARGDVETGLAISFFSKDDGSNARELIKLLEESDNEVPKELREMVPRRGTSSNYSRFKRRC